MQARLNIAVEQQDIDNALRGKSSKCAVANAIRRQVPEAERIMADFQTIRISAGDERRIYITPWRVQDYIVAFDAGDPIEPFEFHLRDAQITKRQRAAKEERATREGRKPRQNAFILDRKGSRAVKVGGSPPRLSRVGYHTHTRVFGRRLMRVNQARAEGDTQA